MRYAKIELLAFFAHCQLRERNMNEKAVLAKIINTTNGLLFEQACC